MDKHFTIRALMLIDIILLLIELLERARSIDRGAKP
jgi:hypothetical protein